MVRHAVDLALLGDAGVGKTSLLQHFIQGKAAADTTPTVGADCYTKVVELPDGDEAEVTVWDSSGQERYIKLTGGSLGGVHGCMLVYDLTVRESFEHVELWHDEYIQNSKCDEPLPPVFVLAGNKLDEVEVVQDQDEIPELQDEEEVHRQSEAKKRKRTVTTAEGLGWGQPSTCTLWKDDMFTKVTVPHFEVSAATGHQVHSAFMELVVRAVKRSVQLAEMGGGSVVPYDGPVDVSQHTDAPLAQGPPKEKWMGRISKQVEIKLALLGDAATGKTSLVQQCQGREFDHRYHASTTPSSTSSMVEVEDKELKIEIIDVPGREKFNHLSCLRGCHVCCIAVAANNRRSLERIPLWKEVYKLETGYRSESSLSFILLYTKADLDDVLAEVPSSEAREWASAHSMSFVACDATTPEKAAAALHDIAKDGLEKRVSIMYDRIQAQLLSSEAGRAEQQRARKKQREAERKSLVKKYPPKPEQGYIDGHVWSGKKGEEDAFTMCPVYSFPIKDLKGDMIDLGEEFNTAVHLPLLLGKISDLQNDLAKMEQRHRDDMEKLRQANLIETATLRREMEESRAQLEKEKQKHDELRLELRLIWQAIESN